MTEFHPCTDSQVMSATSDACVSQSFLVAEVPLNFAPKNEPLVSSGQQAVPILCTVEIDRVHA